MKNIKLLFVLITMISTHTITAQVSINTDGTTPDASAILDLKSTEKGFLTPRMTQAQIETISNPVDGLIVFNTTDSRFYFYDDGAGEWKEMAIGTGTITPTPPWACGDALVDTRDSQSYSTVQIGTQCWMSENMNIGTMINSTNGGTNNDGEQTDNGTFEKYCYDNNTSNCVTYGGLYQWDEMMQYVTTEGTQGICPTGWHLPTDAEWITMEMHLGMTQTQADATGWRGTDEGSKLAGNEPLWYNGILDQNANFGTSGFNGLPGGHRLTGGSFNGLTLAAYFWSSSEDSSDAWARYLFFNETQVCRTVTAQAYGFGVRCVKN